MVSTQNEKGIEFKWSEFIYLNQDRDKKRERKRERETWLRGWSLGQKSFNGSLCCTLIQFVP